MNQKFWKNKKILITGHSGFKGGWLSFFLHQNRCKLYGLSLKPKKKSFFNQTKVTDLFVKSAFIDINNYNNLYRFIKKSSPKIIFHLAAQPLVLDSYESPIRTFQTNAIGTANLIDICRSINSVKTIIIVTTDKCYENNDKKLNYFSENDKLGGKDPYSASKACAELISNSMRESFLIKKKIRLATVRAGNVIGGGDYSDFRIVPDIFDGMKKNKIVNVRNPHAIRPWQHVMELIHGYIKLAEKLHKNINYSGAWNFGPEKKNIKKVKDLVYGIDKIKKFKYRLKKIRKDKLESNFLALNINKINKSKIWKPKLLFRETLKLTVEWYMSNRKEYITKKQISNFLNEFN